jgi:hypothetical protein
MSRLQDSAGGAPEGVPPGPSSETVAQQLTRRARLQKGEIMPSLKEQMAEQERLRLSMIRRSRQNLSMRVLGRRTQIRSKEAERLHASTDLRQIQASNLDSATADLDLG